MYICMFVCTDKRVEITIKRIKERAHSLKQASKSLINAPISFYAQPLVMIISIINAELLQWRAPAAFQSFEITWRIIAASVAKKPSDTRAPRKNLEFSTRSLQNTFRLRVIRVCEMKRDCRKQQQSDDYSLEIFYTIRMRHILISHAFLLSQTYRNASEIKLTSFKVPWLVRYRVKIQKLYVRDPRVSSALFEAWSYVRNSANFCKSNGRTWLFPFPRLSSLWKYALSRVRQYAL